MAIVSTAGISATVVTPTGNIAVQVTETFTVNQPTKSTLLLASGTNTISVPALANGVIIEPGAGNAITLILKGVAGDTGIPMGSTGALKLPFLNPPPASFVIAASGLQTIPTDITFY